MTNHNIKKHKHLWKLSHTDWQFPGGFSGTVTATEYAYFFCRDCLEVIKKEVNHD